MSPRLTAAQWAILDTLARINGGQGPAVACTRDHIPAWSPGALSGLSRRGYISVVYDGFVDRNFASLTPAGRAALKDGGK